MRLSPERLRLRPFGNGSWRRRIELGARGKGVELQMNILGISAFYHDSAAALVVDGDIVAAAQEERFTRKKHDAGFPKRALEFCLAEGRVGPQDLDYVAFYEKPIRKFDRLLETYLAFAPAGFASFRRAIPLWLKEKMFMRRSIRQQLPGYKKALVFPSHHESHAASAFLPSPFAEAAILTMDGVGEWATASIGVGKGRKIELLREMHFPHSLGLLYSAFTYYCGFKVNSGEYKLMGLAPYGEPVYAKLIREKLIRIFDDGSIWMDQAYFDYCGGLTMTSKKFDRLFGGPPRGREAALGKREMDLAASIQLVTEEVMLKMAQHAHHLTGMKHLCLAGGVALNCVGNGRLLREAPFDDIWIQPASGDAGGALGAALFVWHQLLEKPRLMDGRHDRMKGSYLGPRPDRESIRIFLEREAAKFRYIPEELQLCHEVSELLAAGKVVGWVTGKMEFGPRALGARSILGDPRSEVMQSQMNLKIKFRESFRPFAPSVMEDRASAWFEIEETHRSPYMLVVAPLQERHRLEPRAGRAADSPVLERVKEKRSSIPAVTHLDYSARLHTVEDNGGRYRKLLEAFEKTTGCPLLINTSFNIRGEPIVCTSEEAYRCFLNTDMDVLVLEDYVLLKEDNQAAGAASRAKYLRSFELD
jgi:carbamoyltransferase